MRKLAFCKSEAMGIALAAGIVTAAEAREAGVSRDHVWKTYRNSWLKLCSNKSQGLSSAKHFQCVTIKVKVFHCFGEMRTKMWLIVLKQLPWITIQ